MELPFLREGDFSKGPSPELLAFKSKWKLKSMDERKVLEKMLRENFGGMTAEFIKWLDC